jgi:hypothetical protein
MQWPELNWLRDVEVLGRLGRKPLATVLDLLAPFLARQGIALPDPALSDTEYLAELAAMLHSQPVRLAVYLALCFPETSPAQAPGPSPAGATPPQLPGRPRYALRRDGNLWHLTFDGQPAILKHLQGMCYVGEMLSRPGECVKKLNLAAKYSSTTSGCRGSVEVYDPGTGKYDTPATTEPVHEAALATDDAEARRAYKERARELLETIDDPTETERAKEEAREELEEITRHLGKECRQVRDPTKAAGDAVRNTIDRLLRTLLAPGSSGASSQSVRREFAEHLQRYLIIPSRRYASPRARKARGDLAGCLLYDPPEGIVWSVIQ